MNGSQSTPSRPQPSRAIQYAEVHETNESAGVRKELARAKKAKEMRYATIKTQKSGARCSRSDRVYRMTVDSSRRVHGRPRTLYVLSSQGVKARS